MASARRAASHSLFRVLTGDTVLEFIDELRLPRNRVFSACRMPFRIEVAAAKMVNRPPFFDKFAATIRHRDLPGGSSSVEYQYNFTARPAWLRWVLHRLMGAVFRRETRKRLRALHRFFSSIADSRSKW